MKRFLAMLLALVILVGAVPAALAVGTPEGYYGSRLTDAAAIAFYQVLETMDFTSDQNVPVENPAVIGLAERYASGDVALIRSFGAAVDSFRYDHTEFFYVDWDMLSVNVGRRNGQYVVNVGTGRTDSYLRDKNADIARQIADYSAALEAMVADVLARAGTGVSVKDLAKAANDVICDRVTYDFCDDPVTGEATAASKYIRTAYGALVNGRAVCEGYARLYKAVMNRLGVECELISGYYMDGEAFEPHMWNYVQDEEGRWYGVDVTMNDGHRLQAGGIETAFNKYFWQTYEIFAVNHFEDGVVSSVEYDMPYPELYRFWKTPTSSGKFDSGYGDYGGKPGFWFSYDGKSAEELKADGLYMAFRTATTNTGEVRWSAWQSADAMNIYQEGGVVSDIGKTYILMPNIAMFALEAGIFDTPEDVENKVGDTVVSVQYSEEAVTSHLIEKMNVENPTHDPNYIAPSYIRYTEPYNLFQTWMDVQGGKQHVELTYGDPLREIGDGMKLEWGVSSYNNRDLSLEAVRKYAKVENVQFDGDRTISFDITPSRMYNHNMISYYFTIKNMVNIIDGGKDGVALPGFSISCRYEDDIACCKIFNDGRLYVNSYAQPSIAMNGDLSTTGWTYTDVDADGNEVQRRVSESQRSQMALVVTRPNDSEELAAAAEGQAGAAAVRSTTYEIDLNICGKIVSIPNGSYMKLNLGIPDEFAGLAGNENVKFKLYHFKRGADGQIDYSATEEIECVFTPYGIIAEVNSFSPYVLVAVDESLLPEEARDTSKGVALVANGHGGRVESNISVAGTLKEGQTATYTLMPDMGYDVEFVRLNGVDLPIVGNTITLTYDELQSSNTLEVGYVAKSVKEADAGIDNVSPGTFCTVTFYPNGGSEVATDYVESGTPVARPADPTKDGYRFDGWYADPELSQLYDFSTPVTSSITLYAKWTANPSGGTTPTDPGELDGPGAFDGPGASDVPGTLDNPDKPDIADTSDDPVVPENPPVWENPFTDVTESDWYYSAVQFAVDNGLFLGTDETKFTPDGDMTRGMLATVLYRLAKEPESATLQLFSDVPDGQYYTKAVTWAVEKGIVSGYGNGNFGPEEFITREQLAVMLWRYAESPAGTGNLDSFTDADQVDAWAVDALQWAVGQNLIGGKGNGILDPGGKATRAEVAAILMRYCEIA